MNKLLKRSGVSLPLAAAIMLAIMAVAYSGTTYVGQVVQKVDGSGFIQPVSGTVTANITGSTVAVVGMGGAPVAVSAASLPLPAGAATEAKQDAGNASLSAINSKTPALGAAVRAAAVPVTMATDQPAILVDGSAVTQPISAASLPLPAGAATAANQATANASLYSIDGKIPALGQAAMANSLPVAIASNQSAIPVTYPAISAPVISRVVATTTSGELLDANAARKGLECEASCLNTDRVFINFGAGAATNQHKPLESCSSWQPPPGVVVTSALQVISNSGSQAVICVEY